MSTSRKSGSSNRRRTVRAIETKYDGYHFRSRIEARWAVVFNALGQPYEYEKEGYDLGDFWYLCDFWLPRELAWVEIKGKPPTKIEIARLRLLSQHTECRAAYIFYGDIPNPKTWRKTWQAISVIPQSPPLFGSLSDARISAAFTAGRSARF